MTVLLCRVCVPDGVSTSVGPTRLFRKRFLYGRLPITVQCLCVMSVDIGEGRIEGVFGS